mmetsp:Transcript_19425/g.67696  ORF Transcript_19425/g.67696 Transcript_19425/m.67696 type:complete len:340 (+) Transcript_19425:527-1546(+)
MSDHVLWQWLFTPRVDAAETHLCDIHAEISLVSGTELASVADALLCLDCRAVKVLQRVAVALHAETRICHSGRRCDQEACTWCTGLTLQCHPTGVELVAVLLWSHVLEGLVQNLPLKPRNARRLIAVDVRLVRAAAEPLDVCEALGERASKTDPRRRHVPGHLENEDLRVVVRSVGGHYRPIDDCEAATGSIDRLEDHLVVGLHLAMPKDTQDRPCRLVSGQARGLHWHPAHKKARNEPTDEHLCLRLAGRRLQRNTVAMAQRGASREALCRDDDVLPSAVVFPPRPHDLAGHTDIKVCRRGLAHQKGNIAALCRHSRGRRLPLGTDTYSARRDLVADS